LETVDDRPAVIAIDVIKKMSQAVET